MQIRFRRFLSVDSPKAIKAAGYGYLNGINYGAPHTVAGVGNMCAGASAGCIGLCLGQYSGQAAMAKPGEISPVLQSRIEKTVYFMRDRIRFMQEFAFHGARLIRDANQANMGAAIRPNGSWDQLFESIPVQMTGELAEKLSGYLNRPVPVKRYRNLMELLPESRFLDYTKIAKRFNRPLPENYHLTFSMSENNESDARRLLESGFNVAAVFSDGLPDTYLGRDVIDGDKHDLRFLDPKGGFIIGLSPKGRNAKRDQSGFVIRDYSTRND